jgi:hypothetical protein
MKETFGTYSTSLFMKANKQTGGVAGMRSRLRLVALLLVVLLLGIYGVAQAATITKTLKAVYRNIALVVDGKVAQVDEEPFIVDGRVYVPLRHVAQILGAKVDWDDANSRVVITTAPKSDPAAEQAKYQQGYNAGLVQGQLLASKKAYDEGYEKGYDEGYEEGYEEGYDEGYDDGKEESDDDAYDEGYDDGYAQGEEDGRDAAEYYNEEEETGLDWREALEDYMDIYDEDDIIDIFDRTYRDLDEEGDDYTDGFIEGYYDGFKKAFRRYYDY